MRIHAHIGSILLALAGFAAAGPALAATKHGASGPKEAAAVVPSLPNPAALAKMSESQLKAAYISCDARANKETLSTIEAAKCAMMHRELVDRVFGGDNAAFEAWWTANKGPASKSDKPLGAPAKETAPKAVPSKPEHEQNDKLHLPEDPRSPVLSPPPVASETSGEGTPAPVLDIVGLSPGP